MSRIDSRKMCMAYDDINELTRFKFRDTQTMFKTKTRGGSYWLVSR